MILLKNLAMASRKSTPFYPCSSAVRSLRFCENKPSRPPLLPFLKPLIPLLTSLAVTCKLSAICSSEGGRGRFEFLLIFGCLSSNFFKTFGVFSSNLSLEEIILTAPHITTSQFRRHHFSLCAVSFHF